MRIVCGARSCISLHEESRLDVLKFLKLAFRLSDVLSSSMVLYGLGSGSSNGSGLTNSTSHHGNLSCSFLNKSIIVPVLLWNWRIVIFWSLATGINRMTLTSSTNTNRSLSFWAYNMGLKEIREIWIIILRLVLVLKKRLDLALLGVSSEDGPFFLTKLGSQSLIIEILWTDFPNRTWSNACCIHC